MTRCCCVLLLCALMTGLPWVLKQISLWLIQPSAAGQGQPPHTTAAARLKKRMVNVAVYLYLHLPEAAAATDRSDSAVVRMMLADGLQLALQLRQPFLWPLVNMVPRQLMSIAASADTPELPQPETVVHCWQQLVQHKVCWVQPALFLPCCCRSTAASSACLNTCCVQLAV